MGVCGGEEKRTWVWCVAGCGGAPVNKEKKRKKHNRNGNGALIRRVIIKRRDQSLISAISSTLGISTSPSDMHARLCVRVCAREQ